jgi:hypothetical protein
MTKFWADIKAKGIICRKCGKSVYEGIKTSYMDDERESKNPYNFGYNFGEYCKTCNNKLNKLLNGKAISFKSMKEFDEYLMVKRL